MKIFPLKPMSNYDRFNNIMNIIHETKHLHSVQTSGNKLEINVIDTKNYAKNDIWNGILGKYRTRITEFVTGIRKNNG